MKSSSDTLQDIGTMPMSTIEDAKTRPASYSLPHGVNFILCRDCFWCASQLDANVLIGTCRNCSSNALEAIGIASNEKFEVIHGENGLSGLILQFAQDNRNSYFSPSIAGLLSPWLSMKAFF